MLKNSGSSSNTTAFSSLDSEGEGEEASGDSCSLSPKESEEDSTGGILSKSPSLVIMTSSVSVLSSVEEVVPGGVRGTTATLSTERSGIFQCFPDKSLTPPKNHDVRPTGSLVRIELPSDSEGEEEEVKTGDDDTLLVEAFLTVTAFGDDFTTTFLETEFTLLDPAVVVVVV